MEEKGCYNCRYVEFDIGLCTQYFCQFHGRLVRMDGSCDDWAEPTVKKH